MSEFKEKWKSNAVLFLVSQSITLFGSTLVQMAIVWYAAISTSSGSWVAAFTVCAYLPQFLMSFFGGALADRYSRKFLIVISDTIIAAVTLILFFTMPLFDGETPMLCAILAISVIRSIGSGVQTPAVNSVIPQLVPKDKYMRFNSINASMQSLVQFAAPLAAGAILSFATLRIVLLIDVATAAVGIGILLFIFIKRTEEPESQQTFLSSMKQGLKYSFGNPLLLRILITYALFIFLCVPAGFLASLFVSRMYGNDYFYLTAVEVAGFCGMTLGGLLMSVWGGFKKRRNTLVLGLVVFGILAIGMGAIKNFYVYLALMIFYGVALTMVQTSATTMIQENAIQDKQGSVFGLLGAAYSGLLPIGMAVFGPLADVISLPYIMIFSGVLLVILSIFVVFNKKMQV